MTTLTLILRSLRHYWRTNAGIVLGVATAAAVLIGALLAGDSVRLSLRAQAEARIGRVTAGLVARERFFTEGLAERMQALMEGSVVAPALQLPGLARKSDGARRAGIVEVLGVDERFFAASPSGTEHRPPPGKACVNERVARQLAVGPGDTILVRVEKPSLLPRDSLMATIDDVSFALRVEIAEVLGDSEFGAFSLRASQVPPFNVFLDLLWLQRQLELAGRVNALFVAGGGGDAAVRADRALHAQWRLADAQLQLRNPNPQTVELTTDRVFLEQPVAGAVTEIEPRVAGVLTYFVNAIRKGERATPYSTVTAIGPLTERAPRDGPLGDLLALAPATLGADGIAINDWLARDLQARIGDEVTVDFYRMGRDLRLQTGARRFRVRAVVPLSGSAADPGLMPPFPGLAGSESCRDWEPGIPVDLERIRDVDEKYWDEHKGTPKAFVTLTAGRELWSNRYGTLTAIRGPAALAERLRAELPGRLDPAQLGLFFQDVRASALAGAAPATDFGGLFLGLSLFLIAAALLLTALLFTFGVEQRAGEIGTLLAVGLRPASVFRAFLGEASLLAALGSVLGAGLGIGYTALILYGLGTLWRDAVGATTLGFHAPASTLLLGVVLSVVVAVLAIALALRKAFRRPAVELLSARGGAGAASPPAPAQGGWLPAALCAAGAVALVLVSGAGSGQAAGTFFGAGALLLVAGLLACRTALRRAGSGGVLASVAALGARNTARRPGRSLATIALLASGTFLVVAVQAYRLEPPVDPWVRDSGTGGFALFGRSTLPVLRDLSAPAGREAYGIDASTLDGVRIVPLQVRDGDDASCLNLSLPQNPRLLGVAPQALAERGAFRFAAVLDGGPTDGASPWTLLDADFGAGVVPAIGDQASVTWTLHKSLGDTLEYRDEAGRPFRVKIVATVASSILQGSLLVSDRDLTARFPSAAGYKSFLIDAPKERIADVTAKLTRALEDIGLELTPTGERLQQFNAVQNTYLLIFQALGGLGLLLGSLGLGMVVLRNALERRAELAVARAVGFTPGNVRGLLWTEHGLLLAAGLVLGTAAALVAVVPGLRGAGGTLPAAPVLVLVALVAASGALWVWTASVLATRGDLLDVLQSE